MAHVVRRCGSKRGGTGKSNTGSPSLRPGSFFDLGVFFEVLC